MRLAVRVRGTVQGVGFRPFVYGVATRLGLAGHVGNDERGVLLEAEGPEPDLDALVAALRQGPPLAVVTGVECAPLPPRGGIGFVIVASSGHDRAAATTVPPDSATCADCLAELRDPADRRYRHPFVNCTNCGPRLTIVTGVPYDRATTTMAGFAMCPDCAADYHDPADRRFHAQPVCCPSCGPALRWSGAGSGDPITCAATAIAGGAVVAVKGLGGYHLAVLAVRRAGRPDAARPQAPRGPVVRGRRAGPRRRPRALPRRRRRGRAAHVAPGADRPAAATGRRGRRRVGRARRPVPRPDAAVHTRAPPAAGLRQGADRADQRERLRRADRAPRRRRRRAPGPDRRRRPRARPCDPHPRRRLGAARRARAPVPGAPLPWLRPGTDPPGCEIHRAGPRRRCRAEEHVLPAARRPGVRLAPHRRPRQRRDPAGVHRRRRAPVPADRRPPRDRRARPAPGVPVHEVGPGTGRGRSGGGAAPSRAPRRMPGRAR